MTDVPDQRWRAVLHLQVFMPLMCSSTNGEAARRWYFCGTLIICIQCQAHQPCTRSCPQHGTARSCAGWSLRQCPGTIQTLTRSTLRCKKQELFIHVQELGWHKDRQPGQLRSPPAPRGHHVAHWYAAHLVTHPCLPCNVWHLIGNTVLFMSIAKRSEYGSAYRHMLTEGSKSASAQAGRHTSQSPSPPSARLRRSCHHEASGRAALVTTLIRCCFTGDACSC